MPRRGPPQVAGRQSRVPHKRGGGPFGGASSLARGTLPSQRLGLEQPSPERASRAGRRHADTAHSDDMSHRSVIWGYAELGARHATGGQVGLSSALVAALSYAAFKLNGG
jgi:hypothetical protein